MWKENIAKNVMESITETDKINSCNWVLGGIETEFNKFWRFGHDEHELN